MPSNTSDGDGGILHRMSVAGKAAGNSVRKKMSGAKETMGRMSIRGRSSRGSIDDSGEGTKEWLVKKSAGLVQEAKELKKHLGAKVKTAMGKVTGNDTNSGKKKQKRTHPEATDPLQGNTTATPTEPTALTVMPFANPDPLVEDLKSMDVTMAPQSSMLQIEESADLDDIISRVQSRNQVKAKHVAPMVKSPRNRVDKTAESASLSSSLASFAGGGTSSSKLGAGTSSHKLDANWSSSPSSRKANLDQKNAYYARESMVDLIIAFQLYELLQTTWREDAHNFVANPKEVDQEIINQMLENRHLVKEERMGGPSCNNSSKAKLIRHILAAVRNNLEECLLVGHEFKAFLDITIGGSFNFDVARDVVMISKHPELTASYHRLMDPASDMTTCPLLVEWKKPDISLAATRELRCIYDDLFKVFKYDQSETTLRLRDVKSHDDYSVMDFKLYEDVIGKDTEARLSFEAFAALFCPDGSKTSLTLVNTIMQSIRHRTEQLLIADEEDDGTFLVCGESLEHTLAKLEDPLSPTMPNEAHEQFAKIYDSIGWDTDSTEQGRVLQRFLLSFFADRPIQDIKPQKDGSLTYGEFENFVRPDKYKLHANTSYKKGRVQGRTKCMFPHHKSPHQ